MVDAAWLAGLKPGDKVAMDSAHPMRTARYSELTVFARTKTVIKCQDAKGRAGYRFRAKDGYEVGASGMYSPSIEPLTPEIEAEMERSRLVEWARSVAWHRITLDALRKVREALGGAP